MPIRSIVAAIVFVGTAFLLNANIEIFRERGALVLYLAAVVLSIWYGGWRAGVVAAGLAILGAAWILAPGHTFVIGNPADIVRFCLFVAVAILITVMHRSLEIAQKKLALTERRLIASVEAARVAAWEQDLATGVFWCSPNFETIFGGPADVDNPTYEGFLGFTHPDDQTRVRETIAAALQSRPEFEFDHKIVRSDGEIRWIHTRGCVHRDEKGKPVRMVGIAADVTETKSRDINPRPAPSAA